MDGHGQPTRAENSTAVASLPRPASGSFGPVPRKNRPGWLPFLKACAVLGATGFGGGLAILGQAGELFERKRWLSAREWVHTATVAQLLPGGAATNALAYVGLRFFGPAGALAAVGVYVAPAAALMIALGIGYGHVHQIPHLDALLGGFNGALVGLVIAVTWRLGQAGLRRGWQAILAGLALAFERLGHATVLEVIVFGILSGLAADSVQKGLRLRGRRRARQGSAGQTLTPDVFGATEGDDEERRVSGSSGPKPHPDRRIAGDPPPPGSEGDDADADPPAAGGQGTRRSVFAPGLLAAAHGLAARVAGQVPAGTPLGTGFRRRVHATLLFLGIAGVTAPLGISLLLTCARVGAVAYGGGFTIVPLLEREAVEQHGWITHLEFADAIALGQVTPGPVLIAASFIGARAGVASGGVSGGVLGGLTATLGVFGVPALLTIGAGAWLDRWRRTRAVKAALRGLVPAVVGMMAAAAIGLAGAGLRDETGIVLAAVAFVAVAQFRINPAVVVLGSGVVRVLLLVLGNV